MKSVSVIIPIYNKSQYISECLNSVLTQTLEDIEVICIDDGSTDDSVEIVEFFAESHDNIVLIKKENEGVGKARNLGIETATKKYICFMDPDDYYPDDEVLKTLYDLAESNNVKICGGSFSSIKSGELKTDYSYPNEGYRFSKEGIIEYSDYQFDYGFHRFIYRKDMILEKDIRFPNYIRFQDPPFFVSCMISAGSFYATPTETYRYREGYKKMEWNLSKKIDNLQGMLEILDMAHENNLDVLKERMFFRITSDYYRDIIIRNDSRYEFSVVSEILERINKYIDAESRHYIKFSKLFDEVDKNAKKKADIPPRISIVIPVYNVEKYIGECLDSVIHQDFKDIEIICVDDGTKDRSADICEMYAEKDSRITVVHRFNGGLSRARNTGADFADGICLYFLDSDDMLNEGALSRIYKEMSEDDLDALFFDAKTVFESGTSGKHETEFKNQYTDRMSSTGVIEGKVLLRMMIDNEAYRSPVQLSVVSRSFYDSANLSCFPGILHEDNLYTFEVLIYAKRVKYIAEGLYVRRIRGDSIMTSEKSFRNFYGFLKVYTEMNKIIKDATDPDIVELGTVMKERNKRSARVVFENLTFAERNLINNMDVQDRIAMTLDPPFEITADEEYKIPEKSMERVKNNLIDILWDSDSPEMLKQMIEVITPLAEAGDETSMYRLACAYREGKGVYKDLDKATEWMRKAVDSGVTSAIKDLSDLLWNRNDFESHRESVVVIVPLANEGYRHAMMRLGRAYRDGKGVKKDLDKATEWMRKTVEKSNVAGWAIELYDVFWDIDSSESIKEMILTILPYAESGNAHAMMRLGRAYRDGKGVEKDLDKATEWMRKAMDAGSEKARGELYNILWKINTPESLSELMKLIVPFAEAGDGRAMNQLARAYRDGKGVEKDLNKAAEWMRKAVHTGIKWAPNELSEILWQINTPDALNEMVVLIMPMAESGDGRAMNQLARAYRDGKGVVKDLDKATKWMRKAADAGIGRAKLELLELL